jgi:hypothetical protein
MTVERTHANVSHQTRYELHGGAGLPCVLTYTAQPDEPAMWTLLLRDPAGTEAAYGTHRFRTPDAGRLRAWLTPIVGSDHAAELADAVDAAPPPAAGWRHDRSQDD